MNDEEIKNALQSLRDAPRVPADRREAAFERVRSEWQSALAERAATPSRTPNRRWVWGIAASVMMVLFSGLFFSMSRDAADPKTRIATVLAVHGGDAFRINDAVYGKQSIQTGSATLSMRMTSGLIVRAAPYSELTFSDENHLRLEKGRIFVDANPAESNAPLLVETKLGAIRHLGTQYLVEYDRERLNVAVREGVIALQKPAETQALAKAAAGEQLSVSARAPQAIERSTVLATDERWSWVETVASPIDIDGITLGAFLQWYERETGRRVTLGNADPDTRLSGSIAGLTPDDALGAIAVAVELAVVQKDGEVLVSKP